MKHFTSPVRSAIDHYNMISLNDKIAVGISGGKDSLALLYALSDIKKYYPIPFELIAITLDMGINNEMSNYNQIKDFCDNLNINYIVYKTKIGKIVFEDRKEKNPCSLCARMRRGILNRVAKEHGCNKIALGHHLDDAVETFFMNLFNGATLKCFSPATFLSNSNIWMIRPLIFCHESEINSFANKYNLPIQKSLCPVDGHTERQNIKQLIANLELLYPDLKTKVITAIKNLNLNHWKQ